MDYGLYALNTTRMPSSLTSSRLILMTVLSLTLTLTKSGGAEVAVELQRVDVHG